MNTAVSRRGEGGETAVRLQNTNVLPQKAEWLVCPQLMRLKYNAVLIYDKCTLKSAINNN